MWGENWNFQGEKEVFFWYNMSLHNKKEQNMKEVLVKQPESIDYTLCISERHEVISFILTSLKTEKIDTTIPPDQQFTALEGQRLELLQLANTFADEIIANFCHLSFLKTQVNPAQLDTHITPHTITLSRETTTALQKLIFFTEEIMLAVTAKLILHRELDRERSVEIFQLLEKSTSETEYSYSEQRISSLDAIDQPMLAKILLLATEHLKQLQLQLTTIQFNLLDNIERIGDFLKTILDKIEAETLPQIPELLRVFRNIDTHAEARTITQRHQSCKLTLFRDADNTPSIANIRIETVKIFLQSLATQAINENRALLAKKETPIELETIPSATTQDWTYRLQKSPKPIVLTPGSSPVSINIATTTTSESERNYFTFDSDSRKTTINIMTRLAAPLLFQAEELKLVLSAMTDTHTHTHTAPQVIMKSSEEKETYETFWSKILTEELLSNPSTPLFKVFLKIAINPHTFGVETPKLPQQKISHPLEKITFFTENLLLIIASHLLIHHEQQSESPCTTYDLRKRTAASSTEPATLEYSKTTSHEKPDEKTTSLMSEIEHSLFWPMMRSLLQLQNLSMPEQQINLLLTKLQVTPLNLLDSQTPKKHKSWEQQVTNKITELRETARSDAQIQETPQLQLAIKLLKLIEIIIQLFNLLETTLDHLINNPEYNIDSTATEEGIATIFMAIYNSSNHDELTPLSCTPKAFLKNLRLEHALAPMVSADGTSPTESTIKQYLDEHLTNIMKERIGPVPTQPSKAPASTDNSGIVAQFSEQNIQHRDQTSSSDLPVVFFTPNQWTKDNASDKDKHTILQKQKRTLTQFISS
jgi:hypothetical protein